MKKHQYIMVISGLLLLVLFVLPMWRITLEAPQYPDPIGMNIWINKITDYNENDIKNINIMNHYVGMKPIPETMKEFELFPVFAIAMTVLAVIVAFLKNKWLYLAWAILLITLGTIAMYDFYIWEYEYGHNLDPSAAIKIPGQGYQPPLIGVKEILNFRAVSIPLYGAYAIALAIFGSLAAFYSHHKKIWS